MPEWEDNEADYLLLVTLDKETAAKRHGSVPKACL